MGKRRWILLAVLLIPIGLFSLRWLPDPPIEISKETTFITEPLGSDGLPDYFEYLRQKKRAGVTPENNAAVVLMQVVGPESIDKAIRPAWFAELGIESLPEEGEYYVGPWEGPYRTAGEKWAEEILRSSGWTEEKLSADEEAFLDFMVPQVEEFIDSIAGKRPPDKRSALEQEADSEYYDICDNAMAYPWTSEPVPPLAKWARENQKSLDLAREATLRPTFYSPFVRAGQPPLLKLPFSMVGECQSLSRGFATRSMWHAGEGRFAEAQQDIFAIHRLARSVGRQPARLIDLLIAITIDSTACRSHMHLVSLPGVDRELLQRSLDELQSLRRWTTLAETADEFERLQAIDAAQSLRHERGSLVDLVESLNIFRKKDAVKSPLGRGSVDWNIVMRRINEGFDKKIAVIESGDPSVVDKADADFKELLASEEARLVVRSWVSREARSELLSLMIQSVFYFSPSVIMNSQASMNLTLDVATVATALAIYQVDHGEYPESLDSLSPEILDEVPQDVFAAAPLEYQRRADGYLLYSVGGDGQDTVAEVVGKVPDDEVDPEWFGDDIVIRVPIPPLSIRVSP